MINVLGNGLNTLIGGKIMRLFNYGIYFTRYVNTNKFEIQVINFKTYKGISIYLCVIDKFSI